MSFDDPDEPEIAFDEGLEGLVGLTGTQEPEKVRAVKHAFDHIATLALNLRTPALASDPRSTR